METVAFAYTVSPPLGLVQVADPRFFFRGVWLVPGDIQRVGNWLLDS